MTLKETKTQNLLGDDALLCRKEVAGALTISRQTFREMLVSGEFPKPLSISCGIERWKLSTVREWLKEKGAA